MLQSEHRSRHITGGPVPAGITPSTSIDTIAYMSFSPNPIGVGQQLLVNLWVQPATSVARAHTGYSVVITKPDGTTITVGPIVSYGGDTTAWFTYIPSVAGNYTLQFFFAGDYYPKGYYVNGIVTIRQHNTLQRHLSMQPKTASTSLHKQYNTLY